MPTNSITKAGPSATEAARADAAFAATRALQARIVATVEQHRGGPLDFSPAVREFTDALANLAITVDLSPLTSAIEHFLGIFAHRTRNDRERGDTTTASGLIMRNEDGPIHQAALVVLAEADRVATRSAEHAAAVGEAQVAVDELTGQLTATSADLEAALDRGDLTTVMNLRGQVAVELPSHIATARLALLDAQLLDLRAQCAHSAQRSTMAAGAETAAREALASLVKRHAEELAAAEAALDESRRDNGYARSVHNLQTPPIAALQAERDALAQTAQTARADAMRRLAGL